MNRRQAANGHDALPLMRRRLGGHAVAPQWHDDTARWHSHPLPSIREDQDQSDTLIESAYE